jgi:hypothetical protein
VVWDPLHGRREASVYGRGETYVVTSARRFGYGPDYRFPPYFVLPRKASDEELGAAVFDAIEGFTVLAEEPSDDEVAAAVSELFAVVGVASHSTFERGASLVEIEEWRGRWVVEPWGRRHGYWAPLNEETFVKLSRPSENEVGAAVRRAFVTLRGRP